MPTLTHSEEKNNRNSKFKVYQAKEGVQRPRSPLLLEGQLHRPMGSEVDDNESELGKNREWV